MVKTFRWEMVDDVAHLILANPPVNLIDLDALDEYGEAVAEIVESDARAVLLRAEGKVFSAGADVSTFEGVDSEEARRRFTRWLPYVQALEAAPVPTVAAVHGMCLAGGLELALACDVILAAEGTKLGQTEATVGTTTLLGGAQRVAQRAGAARAKMICFGAQLYDAAQFERWGIVDQVLPAETFLEEATALAVSYAQGPTAAHRAVKGMIAAGVAGGVSAADRFLLDEALSVFDTRDMAHGVEMLMEHGATRFTSHTTFSGL